MIDAKKTLLAFRILKYGFGPGIPGRSKSMR